MKFFLTKIVVKKFIYQFKTLIFVVLFGTINLNLLINKVFQT